MVVVVVVVVVVMIIAAADTVLDLRGTRAATVDHVGVRGNCTVKYARDFGRQQGRDCDAPGLHRFCCCVCRFIGAVALPLHLDCSGDEKFCPATRILD